MELISLIHEETLAALSLGGLKKFITTMMSLKTEKEGLRQRVRRRYNRLRNKPQDSSKNTQTKQILATKYVLYQIIQTVLIRC